MKTKKILSLLLAITMLAAMTISASAATEVFFYEDFESSDGTAGAWLSENVWSFGAASHSLQLALDSYYDAEKANGKAFMIRSSNGGNPSAARSTIITNSLGSTALKTFGDGKGGASTQSHEFYMIPEHGYNIVANPGKALVFSAELQFDPPTATQANKQYATFTTYFTDAAATDNAYTSVNGHSPISITATATDVDTNAEDDVHDYQVTSITATLLHHKVTNAGVRVYSTAEGAAYPFATGEAHRVAMSYHYDSSKKYPIIKSFAWDGDYVGKSSGTADNSLTVDKPIIRAFNFANGFNTGMSYANIKAYIIDTAAGSFNVSTTAGDVVPATVKTIPVKFSQPVTPEKFSATAVTVTKNGEPLTYGEDFSVTGLTQVVGEVGGEAYSTANVVFEDLDQSSEYVITFPATITNELGTTLEGYNTISFTTPEPDIKINGFDVVKGWGTADEATATAFAADGSLQGAAIAVENTTAAEKNVAVIYAVYGANGQLSDVVYANDTVAAETKAEIGAGLKLAAEGTVKAFVWDGISSLKPHAEATVKTIAAAE